MMSTRAWFGVVALSVLYVLDGPSTLLAQDVTLNQSFAGDRVVTGEAARGSAPITVLDTSSGVPRVLGRGTGMDTEGNFAVSVDPPLAEGQTVLAVDAQGRASLPISVLLPGPPAGR